MWWAGQRVLLRFGTRTLRFLLPALLCHLHVSRRAQLSHRRRLVRRMALGPVHAGGAAHRGEVQQKAGPRLFLGARVIVFATIVTVGGISGQPGCTAHMLRLARGLGL